MNFVLISILQPLKYNPTNIQSRSFGNKITDHLKKIQRILYLIRKQHLTHTLSPVLSVDTHTSLTDCLNKTNISQKKSQIFFEKQVLGSFFWCRRSAQTEWPYGLTNGTRLKIDGVLIKCCTPEFENFNKCASSRNCLPLTSPTQSQPLHFPFHSPSQLRTCWY